MELKKGDTITLDIGGVSRAKVKTFLGHGEFAEVWEIEDLTRKQSYALKYFNLAQEEPADKARSLNRIEREGSVNIASPYVIKCFGYGPLAEEDHFGILMEVVRAPTLSEWLQAHPQAAWKDKKALFLKILQGIQAAHAKGMAHRDLKPDNILVTDNHLPKIIDFGFVKKFSYSNPNESQVGQIMGTPPYMDTQEIFRSQNGFPSAVIYKLAAPILKKLGDPKLGRERIPASILTKLSQLQEEFFDEADFTAAIQGHLDEADLARYGSTLIKYARRVDIRCDIYALGILLYTMIMGQDPWYTNGITSFKKFKKFVSQDKKYLNILDIDKKFVFDGTEHDRIKQVIQHSTVFEAKDRTQTVEEMISELGGQPIAARTPIALIDEFNRVTILPFEDEKDTFKQPSPKPPDARLHPHPDTPVEDCHQPQPINPQQKMFRLDQDNRIIEEPLIAPKHPFSKPFTKKTPPKPSKRLIDEFDLPLPHDQRHAPNQSESNPPQAISPMNKQHLLELLQQAQSEDAQVAYEALKASFAWCAELLNPQQLVKPDQSVYGLKNMLLLSKALTQGQQLLQTVLSPQVLDNVRIGNYSEQQLQAFQQELSNTLDALNKKIQEVQACTRQKQQLEDARAQISALDQQRQDLEKEIERLQGLTKDQEAIRQQLRKLQDTKAQLDAQVAIQEQARKTLLQSKQDLQATEQTFHAKQAEYQALEMQCRYLAALIPQLEALTQQVDVLKQRVAQFDPQQRQDVERLRQESEIYAQQLVKLFEKTIQELSLQTQQALKSTDEQEQALCAFQSQLHETQIKLDAAVRKYQQVNEDMQKRQAMLTLYAETDRQIAAACPDASNLEDLLVQVEKLLRQIDEILKKTIETNERMQQERLSEVFYV